MVLNERDYDKTQAHKATEVGERAELGYTLDYWRVRYLQARGCSLYAG